MCVRSQGDTECSRQAKVSQLQVALSIDEQILGLEIPVQHTMRMAVESAFYKLAHELLDHVVAKAKPAQFNARTIGQGLSPTTIADWQSLHILLEVEVEEFEDQVELVAIGMHDVE
jgi:hypothetical protein